MEGEGSIQIMGTVIRMELFAKHVPYFTEIVTLVYDVFNNFRFIFKKSTEIENLKLED